MADKKDVKDVKSNPLAGGCPVPHDKRGGAAAVNPHGTGAAAASVTASTHAATATERATQRAEVPDTAERELKLPSMTGAHHNVKVERAAGEAGDFVPDSTIPAAGRGNSDDGKNWLNPSANQLFRALARKNKPIESDDAPAVAMVHEMVTNGTWAAIMEYEAMHSHKCRAPKLDRFQGMDGIYSAKAKLVRLMTGAVPFDRHDWYINRCGKEVKYIIDYYEIPEPNGQISYSVDARPAPTPSGIWDRMRMAWKKWRAGEQMAGESASNVASLLSWLAKESKSQRPPFTLDPSVEVFHSNTSGFGLRLKSALTVTAGAESQLLAEMPRSLMLHPNTTKSAIADRVPKTTDGWTSIVLILLHEVSLGAASYWYEWLKCLPAYDALGVPFVWESDELQELQGTSVMDKTDFSELEIDFRTKILPFLNANARLPTSTDPVGLFPTYAKRIAAAAQRKIEFEQRKKERSATAAAAAAAAGGTATAAVASAPEGKNAAKNRKKKLNKKKAGAVLSPDEADAKAVAEADAADEANDVCSIRGYKQVVSWVMTRAFAAHTRDGKDFDLAQRDSKQSAAAADSKTAGSGGSGSGSGPSVAVTTTDNIWMCPVLDFVNSDARADAFNAHIAWTEHSIQLRSIPLPAGSSNRVLPAGTELLINYADSVQSDSKFHSSAGALLSNSELLRRYGFVLESYDQPTAAATTAAAAAASADSKSKSKSKSKSGKSKAAPIVPLHNKYSQNDTVDIPVVMVAATCKQAVDDQLGEIRRAAAAAEKKRKHAASKGGSAKKTKGGAAAAAQQKVASDDESGDDGTGAGGDESDGEANEYGVGGLDYEYFVIGRDGVIPPIMRQLTQRYARMLDPDAQPTASSAAGGDSGSSGGIMSVPFDPSYDDDLELLFLVIAQRLADYGSTLEQDREMLHRLITTTTAAAAASADSKSDTKQSADAAEEALTQYRLRQALIVRIGEKEILEGVIEQLKAKIQAIDDAAEAEGLEGEDDGDEGEASDDDDGDASMDSGSAPAALTTKTAQKSMRR